LNHAICKKEEKEGEAVGGEKTTTPDADGGERRDTAKSNTRRRLWAEGPRTLSERKRRSSKGLNARSWIQRDDPQPGCVGPQEEKSSHREERGEIGGG